MKVLDGCSGAGGAARGLAEAGNEVWGVDTNPRLRDAYLRSGAAGFICADILDVLADASFMARFDAASLHPPCQAYSKMSRCRPGLAATYPRLIKPIQPLLDAWGGPFAIENVSGARSELRNPVTLCMWGHFGRETYRHRLIEAGGGLVLTPPPPALSQTPLNGSLKPNRECGRVHPVATARAPGTGSRACSCRSPGMNGRARPPGDGDRLDD